MGDRSSEDSEEIHSSGTEVTDDKSDEEPAKSRHPQTDGQLVSSAKSQGSGKQIPSFDNLKEQLDAIQNGTSHTSTDQGSGFPNHGGARATYFEDFSSEHQGLADDLQTFNVANVPGSSTGPGPSPETSLPSQSPSRSLTPLDRRLPSSLQSILSTLAPHELRVFSSSEVKEETGSIGSSVSGSPSWSIPSPSWSIPSTPQPSNPSTSPSKKSSLHKGDALTPSTVFGPYTEFGPSPKDLHSPSPESALYLPYQNLLPPSGTFTSHPSQAPHPSGSSTPFPPRPRPPPPPPPPNPFWLATPFPPLPPPPYPSRGPTPFPPLPPIPLPYSSGKSTLVPLRPPPPYQSGPPLLPTLPYPGGSSIPLPLPRGPPPPYRTPPHPGSLPVPFTDQANMQRKWLCTTCGKTDVDRNKVVDHWIEQHISGYCKYCNKPINTFSEFYTHMNTKHSNSARVALANSSQPSTPFRPPTPQPTSSRSEISSPSARTTNPSTPSEQSERSRSVGMPSRVQISSSQSPESARSLLSFPSESSTSIRLPLLSTDQGNAENVEPFPPGDCNESTAAFEYALAHIVIEHSYSATAGDLNMPVDGTQPSNSSPPPSSQPTSPPSAKLPSPSPPSPHAGRLPLTLLSSAETPQPESRPSEDSLPLSPSYSSRSVRLSLPARELSLSIDQGATGLDAYMMEGHSYTHQATELNTPENRTRPSTPFRPPTPHPTSSRSEPSPPSAKIKKPSPPGERFERYGSLKIPSPVKISLSQSRGRSLPSSPRESSTSTRFPFTPRQLFSSADQGATGQNMPESRNQPSASLPSAYPHPTSSRSKVSPPSEKVPQRGRPLGKSPSLGLPSRAGMSSPQTCSSVKSFPSAPSVFSASNTSSLQLSPSLNQGAAEPNPLEDHSNSSSTSTPEKVNQTCSECSYKASSVTKLIIHRKSHLKHHCQLCKTRYNTIGDLNSHIRRIHDNNEKFSVQCQHCKDPDTGKRSTFSTIKDFNSHVENVMKYQKNAKICPICGREFDDSNDMRDHYDAEGDEHYDDIPDLDHNKKNNHKKDDDDEGGGAGGGQQLFAYYAEINNNFQPMEKNFVDKPYEYKKSETEKMLKISSKSYSNSKKIGKENVPHFVTEIQNKKLKLPQAKTLVLTECSECNFPKLLETKQRGKMNKKNSNPRFFQCKKCGKRFRRKKLLKLHCSKFCHIKGHTCR